MAKPRWFLRPDIICICLGPNTSPHFVSIISTLVIYTVKRTIVLSSYPHGTELLVAIPG